MAEVLERSRLARRSRPLRLRRGLLGAYVHDIVEGRRPFLEAEGFELRVSVPDRALPGLYDAQALEQIVVNLLDNAAKHARGGAARRVEVEVFPDGSRGVVRIADRGPGPGRAGGEGTGLSLVRELAAWMDGAVDIGAREGGGTDARVSVPRA